MLCEVSDFYVYLLYGLKFSLMFSLTGVIRGGYRWLNWGTKCSGNTLDLYSVVNKS